jgi:DNA-binding GntR family transcriptional regulator
MPVPVDIQPIGRQRAREIVAECLRAWIVDGDLAPGEIVKDNDIAAALGVSRTPVREALLHLEREGLIESLPGRWTRVAQLDASLSERLYPVIIVLEALSSSLAAANGAEHLPGIEAANQRFAVSVERYASTHAPEDAREVREADDAFHGAILRAADNPHLSDALLPRKVMARRFENWYFGNTPSIGAASIADHERIIAALRAGDAEGAAEQTRRNWARSLALLSPPNEREG